MKFCDLYFKKGNLLLNEKLKLIKQGMTTEAASECLYAFCHNEVTYSESINIVKIPASNVFRYDGNYGTKAKDYNNYINWLNKTDMKFDNIILNPPYSRSLHLKFLEIGLNLLSEKGTMVIIEPANWLINVRKYGGKNEPFRTNSSAIKKYDSIKNRIKCHVESIVIENLNNEFLTTRHTPFSITTINMSRTFDKISYDIFGEHKEVDSIYDCNHIGKYETIWSILEKVQTFGDVMKNHITNKKINGDYWYSKYAEMISGSSIGCSAVTERVGISYESETLWLESLNGKFEKGYFSASYHDYNNEISNTPLCSYDSGKHLTDKIADNIYGTKEELENWKHFIFNNKLPLFINIVMNIDQSNNSTEFLPWLVDNQYTDEEINKLFNFTDEEIKLIDTTIKKYERNSPWFKRYMCGKDAATNEEVMNYINEISK